MISGDIFKIRNGSCCVYWALNDPNRSGEAVSSDLSLPAPHLILTVDDLVSVCL